jgi:outer membrane immunogenic protein
MRKTMWMASAAIGLAALPLGAADAQTPLDWSGGYLGLHAGYLWGDVDVSDGIYVGGGGAIHGPIAGALAGYNFPSTPLPPVVFGVEADFGLGNVTGTGIPCEMCDEVATYTYDLEWDAHFRVRAGVPGGTVMPFLAAGLALADLNVTSDEVFGGVFVGGTIGGGVDVKLGPRLIGRVEGLYDWYAHKDYDEYGVDFTAFTARAALILRLP